MLEKNGRNKRNKHKQYRSVRLMFQDEASFGRISEPTNCWAPPKCRPSAPCQRIREYKPVYGAVSPLDGESYFMVLEKCNSENMGIYLNGLSLRFKDDLILLCVDRASYHTSKILSVPKNIRLFFLPPRTPEMNPVELMWREIRKRGFKNKAFPSIAAVIDKFYEVIKELSHAVVKSLTLWTWIENILAS